MNNLWQDLRYGIRIVLKNPGFTAVVVLALAIGIGANTAIFSVVNAILLRPLPYKNFGRISMIWMDNPKLGVKEDWHSYPNYLDFKEQNQVFEDMAAFNDRSFNLTGAGDPVRVLGAWSTASLFTVLGIDAALGQVFTVENEEPGKDLVVVLSDGLWKRRFGSDPGIIRQSISMSGVNRIVIGVMPPSFKFPEKTTE
ncbi:MAG TPA: ABC transporter permease, partial [Blastocatellia bacterium]|nr:ABC transporter permease [Blastocatellia bacterium]